MNVALKEKLKGLPRTPGVYFHKSKTGEVIYVGKAAVLKNRVQQYFQNSRGKDAKTLALVAEIVDTDWVETESEIDALFLESEMVKRYMPRYNVLLRDDKSQLFIRINMKDEWPHVSFTRNPSDDGAEYFGPFYNGYALKKALRYLRQVFPYFIAPPSKQQSKLDQDLRLSPRIQDGSAQYKANLKKLISYIKGNRVGLVREIEDTMKKAADDHQFELAAVYRNKLRALGELRRRVVFSDREFLDISKDQALGDIASLLHLKEVPKRIEGYDISHHGGKNVVASMVVFTNGASNRAEYRKFKVSERNDDTGNMREVLTRRLKHLKDWGKPDLVIVDGGIGQVRAVADILKEYEIAVVGRNKSGNHSRNAKAQLVTLEEIIELKPDSHMSMFIARVDDEAHRFAVSYHTSLKRAGATKSTLEDVPGIGPATRRKLIKSFGSMRGVLTASNEELASVVGKKKAGDIIKQLGQADTLKA